MNLRRRRGIILHGYYGCGNLGDDLLLIVLTTELRRLVCGAHFLVRDHGDVAGLEGLGPDVEFTHIETILSERQRGKIARLTAYLAAWFRLLGRGRWLVFGGGTLFHARGSLTSLLLQWAICLLARARGVRVAALGVGVADLPPGFARWLMRRIVGLTELFLVRDEAGLEQCRTTKARLTGDLVFAWCGLEGMAARPAVNEPGTIGLTVYPPALQGDAGSRALAVLAKAVAVWRSRGHRVVFLVFCRGGGDAAFFRRLAAASGTEPPETRVLTPEAASLRASLADIDLICGMRFHGLVLSAMLGRPFVGLAHDNKLWDICQRFGMPCLDAGTFTAAALVPAVLTAFASLPVIGSSVASSRDNFQAMALLLRREVPPDA